MRRHTFDIKKILAAISEVTEIPVLQIIGNGREHELVALRWVAMRIAREDGYSLTEIGRAVGGRDHTTVLAGVLSAGEHIKAATARGRYMMGVEREVRALLGGQGWARPAPLDPSQKGEKDEAPKPEADPDPLAAVRVARIMSGNEAPIRVTQAGFINRSGEIVLWGD